MSIRTVMPSILLTHLALRTRAQIDARTNGSTSSDQAPSSPMAQKRTYRLPAQDDAPYPAMTPPQPLGIPFLDRVYDLTQRWIQEEWLVITALKRDAARNGKKPIYLAAIEESRLTPDNLAKRLDNISQATLRRELKKLNAPSPGQIIRKTRIAYAKHLLTHTRMMVRDIAQRAGYENERHFGEVFATEENCSPTEYRRKHVAGINHQPPSDP